jgi:hypothetical protein
MLLHSAPAETQFDAGEALTTATTTAPVVKMDSWLLLLLHVGPQGTWLLLLHRWLLRQRHCRGSRCRLQQRATESVTAADLFEPLQALGVRWRRSVAASGASSSLVQAGR